ncbi:amino acid ABC transporter permease [Nocardioides sp. WS12]|uniref:amino acid ABC transporter permease n=1 Tax=Nocardioides sp. WS12 TaxID=2486272 RepID=UPI0015F82921|nr:amino acid ABC transporter permease [Nocardioides sp. WS12]
MSNSVLFDAPGPKTVLRHRAYAVATGLALLGIAWYIFDGFNDAGQFDYEKKWEVFTTPDFIRALLVDGLFKTLQMAFGAILGAIVFGVVFGIGKLSEHRWIRWPSAVIVEFFRAVPVLLLMVFIWFSLGIKEESSSFWAVVFALTLYNGAVLAEVLRAGINAVPKGQGEAAYAIGMRKTQVMANILLPQGVKIMLPSLVSQCIVALKDTALGTLVLAPGLTKVGTQIYLEFNNRVPTMFVVATLYISVNFLLMLLANWLQKRYVGEKKLQVALPGTVDTGAGGAGGM